MSTTLNVGELLNLVGLSTGVVLYAMLLAMVVRAGRTPGLKSGFDPLLLLTSLLGLGWNFCFVGGSALLADQLSPLERSRTQGTNDLLVGLASAFISLSSGFIFEAAGYTVIAIIAGALALVPLLMSLAFLRRKVVTVGAS